MQNPTSSSSQGFDPREGVPGLATRSVDTSVTVRDHLANERTLLAYLRTGVAILALGLVIERFSLFQRLMGVAGVADFKAGYGPLVGIAIMWLGFLLVPLSLWRFLLERRYIGPPFPRAPVWPVVLLATTLALCSVVLMAVVLLERSS